MLEAQAVGPPSCPQDELCLDWIYRFRIATRTLSGRRVPSPVTAELIVHGPPSRSIHIVLLIRRGEPGGPWIGQALTSALPGDRACLEAELLSRVGLAPPRGARRRGNQVCFAV